MFCHINHLAKEAIYFQKHSSLFRKMLQTRLEAKQNLESRIVSKWPKNLSYQLWLFRARGRNVLHLKQIGLLTKIANFSKFHFILHFQTPKVGNPEFQSNQLLFGPSQMSYDQSFFKGTCHTSTLELSVFKRPTWMETKQLRRVLMGPYGQASLFFL